MPAKLSTLPLGWIGVALLALAAVVAWQVRSTSEPDLGYAFLATHRDGSPVTWDPCRPIPYVVNPAGAPADWRELVGTAVDRVSEASGLEFADLGTTEDRNWSDRRAGDPVLVLWGAEADHAELDGPVLGMSGATYWPGSRYYQTGWALLESEAYQEMEPWRAQRVTDHELAHVVGLGHVLDRSQVMYEGQSTSRVFAEGDLAGLARVGPPCS